jgi:bifunctional UDP-N-acetylglucosamine pyrophosphorylase/glucosamine-1-phosphate N-acetyltransferase
MKSAVPKVLHPLCGRPMLAFVLDAWDAVREGSATGPVSAGRPIVVYSPPVEAIRAPFADRADFALQDEPLGTGDAVRAALAAVPPDAEEIVVLSGDVPLVSGEDLEAVLLARREDDAAIALATVFAADPGPLGRVVRSEFGIVESIVEVKDASEDELANNEVNVGLYAFDAAWLRRRIGSLAPSAATGGCISPSSCGSPGRTVGSSAPSPSTTTAASTASTTAPNSRPPSGACGSAATRSTCARA